MVSEDHSSIIMLHAYRRKGNDSCMSMVLISNTPLYSLFMTLFLGMSQVHMFSNRFKWSEE